MTAPNVRHWFQSVVCQITPRPPVQDKVTGKMIEQPDEILIHPTYGQAAATLTKKAPKRPVPSSEAPPLPAGVQRTCDDRVLVYDVNSNGDRELSGLEIGQCRNWLMWRWGGNQHVLRPVEVE